jgi:hypothetical protein
VNDQQATGIRESFRQLIPSCMVSCNFTVAHQLESDVGEPFIQNPDCGLVFRDGGSIVWMAVPGHRFVIFRINRPELPLTRGERDFLNYFRATALGLLVQSDLKSIKITERIASRYSFEHVFVSRYLRRKRSGTLWTSALILSELQELSFQKYEGQPCTSGFVFFSEPEIQIKTLAPEYLFQPFTSPVQLAEGFFSTPAAYRYVDGRNAFYVVDNWQRVYGVVRLREPTRYSRVARSAYDHVEPLLRGRAGRAWVACSNHPTELEAITRARLHLRWNKSHWHFIDRSILHDFLLQRDVPAAVTKSLVEIMFAMSDMHVGTVVLIPNDVESLPGVAGQIDSSPLATALLSAFSGRLLPDLVADNSIVGVLGSDGLTTIERTGVVRSSGQIIDLLRERASDAAGGGRTQAALAASRHGTVIKVSQDGPISLFYGGREILKYNV